MNEVYEHEISIADAIGVAIEKWIMDTMVTVTVTVLQASEGLASRSTLLRFKVNCSSAISRSWLSLIHI